MPVVIQQDAHKALTFEQLTIDSTSGGVKLTASKYQKIVSPTQSISNGGASIVSNAKSAVITVEGSGGVNDIRVTYDGTAPTSTVGHLIVAGSVLVLEGTGTLQSFRAIKAGATNGAISVTYWE